MPQVQGEDNKAAPDVHLTFYYIPNLCRQKRMCQFWQGTGSALDNILNILSLLENLME
jgi:hypothetical protein